MNFIRTCEGRAINMNMVNELFNENIKLDGKNIGSVIFCYIQSEKIVIAYFETYEETEKIFSIGLDSKYSDFQYETLNSLINRSAEKLVIQEEKEDFDDYYLRLEKEISKIIGRLEYDEGDWC